MTIPGLKAARILRQKALPPKPEPRRRKRRIKVPRNSVEPWPELRTSAASVEPVVISETDGIEIPFDF
jgi:hypothetical protein